MSTASFRDAWHVGPAGDRGAVPAFAAFRSTPAGAGRAADPVTPRRTTLITADPVARTAVVRLGALAGVAIDVVTASDGARGAWRSAGPILVGADRCEAVVRADLGRRADLVVVAMSVPDEALWRAAVELGAARLVELPADEAWLVEYLGDSIDRGSGPGWVIGCLGGCGGAGASTFAAVASLVSARRARTVLLDADPLGGGLDVLLGLERKAGARWPDVAAVRGRIEGQALADAVPHLESLAVLSWDRSGGSVGADAAGAVLSAAVRAGGRVVVDLPRRPDPASVAFVAALDLLILVVPATVRATAASAALLRQDLGGAAIRLVVRDPGGRGLAASEVAAALGLSVTAVVRSEAAVIAAANRGEPPPRHRGSLVDACRTVLALGAERAAAA